MEESVKGKRRKRVGKAKCGVNPRTSDDFVCRTELTEKKKTRGMEKIEISHFGGRKEKRGRRPNRA